MTGNISYAAAQVGFSPAGLYKLRAEDPSFQADWAASHAAGVEALEQEARRRAFAGVKRVDVTYDKEGNIIHRKVVTEYSDTLLIFLLKAAKPNTYRDVVRVENVDVSSLSDDELEAIIAGEVPGRVRTAAPAPDKGFIN